MQMVAVKSEDKIKTDMVKVRFDPKTDKVIHPCTSWAESACYTSHGGGGVFTLESKAK